MASFVVLTPPDGDDRDERAVFIRDGFSWLALFFHVIWLFWHRLWFAAAVLFLVLVGLVAVAEAWPQWASVTGLALLILAWFVALEGNGMRIVKKERQGWHMRAVIEAQNAATAEEIYYAGDRGEQIASRPAGGHGEKRAALKPSRTLPAESGPALGLLDLSERH